MRTGKYTIDSIEKGVAKLLYREDELMEELVPLETFPFDVKEGDILLIEEENGKLKLECLKDEKEDILKQVRALKKELLDRNN
ncbi:DUF3006 family protein [Pseudobacillus wudalianchiensis]|uniref:Uncharacterized protein n=1 Tax=Pseudobacillus wudalianchiensis TaxID=1743143 RepID=A0A1B9AMW6_9BACI|nr:DUF3006 family protein [Bacillus wudalianchiensis]OCA85273.1 hypothetical protein A8F95_11420 [Bacillus wudalianchiensis]